jgi:hypothetical protein
VRKIIALGVSAGLLVSLAACSTSEPSGECTPSYTSGNASSIVTATGAFGSAPTVSFPTPLISDEIQISVLEKGDGPVAYDGFVVDLYATGYDGASGALAAPSASYDTPPYTASVNDDSDSAKIFECVTVGSRIAVVLPPAENSQGASSIYIFDIADTYYGKAAGTINMPEAGFPSVVTTPDGQPGVTILSTPAPTELSYSTLVTGPGATIAAGDTVKLKYSAFDWTTKTQVSSTWTDNGAPVERMLVPYSSSATNGVAAGVLKALIGKTVGSQVIVVVPPKSYAEGIDFDAASGSTLVIVYDILAVTN